MTTMYVVRHCEAIGNRDLLFQGRFDGDVTENGAAQLRELGRRFETIPLEAVYSSSLCRARKTAAAMIGEKNIPLYIDDRLIEINGGDWEKRPWAELPAKYPEACERWVKRPWEFEAPNGETMREVYDRVSAALREIARRHDGQIIGIASHGCAVRNMLCFVHGKPVTEIGDIPWCDNTAVNILEGDGETWRIVLQNDTSHLHVEASKQERQSWWRTETAGR